MTHIAIKTMAMILDAGRDTLNGKLIFDKYYYEYNEIMKSSSNN